MQIWDPASTYILHNLCVKEVVNSFVICRVDYCYSLQSPVPHLTWPAAVYAEYRSTMLIVGAKKHEHIKRVNLPNCLYRLSVPQCVRHSVQAVSADVIVVVDGGLECWHGCPTGCAETSALPFLDDPSVPPATDSLHQDVSSCWLGLSALQKKVFQSVCTITTSADVQGAAWSSTIPYIVDLRQPVTSVGSRQTSVHHTRDLVVCSFCHTLIWHPRICCGGSQGLEPTAGAHSSTGNS